MFFFSFALSNFWISFRAVHNGAKHFLRSIWSLKVDNLKINFELFRTDSHYFHNSYYLYVSNVSMNVFESKNHRNMAVKGEILNSQYFWKWTNANPIKNFGQPVSHPKLLIGSKWSLGYQEIKFLPEEPIWFCTV